MDMADIYFIEGDYNSGKSTLVNCLTGIDKTYYNHPDRRNIALLDWSGNNIMTLVLNSSLNEGNMASARNRLTLPNQLSALIDLYVSKFNVNSAILTINSSTRNIAYNSAAYATLINNQRIGPHIIRRVVTLGNRHGVIARAVGAAPATCLVQPAALAQPTTPRNTISAVVRQNWMLT